MSNYCIDNKTQILDWYNNVKHIHFNNTIKRHHLTLSYIIDNNKVILYIHGYFKAHFLRIVDIFLNENEMIKCQKNMCTNITKEVLNEDMYILHSSFKNSIFPSLPIKNLNISEYNYIKRSETSLKIASKILPNIEKSPCLFSIKSGFSYTILTSNNDNKTYIESYREINIDLPKIIIDIIPILFFKYMLNIYFYIK